MSGALTALLADVFAVYIKTKNFHWRMSPSILRRSVELGWFIAGGTRCMA
jgi:hypothetical protein